MLTVGDAQVELLVLDRPAHQAHRALADAEDAPAIALDGARDHGADRGVEPGAIAAAGQDADGLRRGERHARVSLPLDPPLGAVRSPCAGSFAILLTAGGDWAHSVMDLESKP